VFRLLPPLLAARRGDEPDKIAFGRFEFVVRNEPGIVMGKWRVRSVRTPMRLGGGAVSQAPEGKSYRLGEFD